jgi:hypothetical protein
MTQIPYPPALTDKDWQKKKGLLAKVKIGETGMGAKLKVMEEGYAKIPWGHFEVKPEYSNIKQWQIEYDGAKSDFTKTVVPFIQTVRSAGSHAKEKAEELKSKASNDVINALKEITKACDNFVLSLKNLGDVGREFEKVRPGPTQPKDVGQVRLPDLFNAARIAVQNWQKTGAMDSTSWNKFRGLSAVVCENQAFASVKDEWHRLSSLGPEKLGTPIAVKEHGQKCLNLLAHSEKLIPN